MARMTRWLTDCPALLWDGKQVISDNRAMLLVATNLWAVTNATMVHWFVSVPHMIACYCRYANSV